MIPNNDNLQVDFTEPTENTRTFAFNRDDENIIGFTDELAAVVQHAYINLNIERYQYSIYSWDTGIELIPLIGTDSSFYIPELKRIIPECLMRDTRVTDVTDFIFDVRKSTVNVTFTMHTIYGDQDMELEVAV